MLKMILILILPIISYSAESGLPFIINNKTSGRPLYSDEIYQVDMKGKNKHPKSEIKSEETVKYIPYAEVQKLLTDARETICKVNPKGEFKVWLKVDASNKIFGFGASGEAGIEVLIKCI